MMDSINHPLNYLCEEWLSILEISKRVKEEQYGQYAREAAKFYDGNHDWMWENQYAKGQGGFLSKDASSDNLPMFRMTVNRVFEAVALFGPALYHRYPNVMVSTVKPPEISPEVLGFNLLNVDPQDPNIDFATQQAAFQEQQAFNQLEMQEALDVAMSESCASVKQHVLNWLQVETNKRRHCRTAVGEAIVKGAGYLYTEIYTPRGSQRKYPRSRHISSDDVFKDPDASYHEDVQWTAIRHCHPRNLVARKFGIPIKELQGSSQSYNSQGTRRAKREANQNKNIKGESFDLLEYYEIFSKNGFGDRLKSTNKQSSKGRFDFGFFGDNCRIVVAKGVPFPLNMPTRSLGESDEQLFMRSQWPIPFWNDEGCAGGWPFAELGFYEKDNCVWPISLIKPAIGELRFVNWCMSFLADKVAAACTDYVAVIKEAGKEIQSQIRNKMGPYTVLEISQITGRKIDDVVSFLSAPSFSQDIWKMVAEVLELIDKRTGLTELIYGLTGTQMRSAQEASLKQENISIRPDDMATKTEDWLSESATKEIQAAVWSCDGNDLVGCLGQKGAYVWDSKIKTMDFEQIVRDYKYRIEAGSARKPNKANRLRSLNEFATVSMKTIENFAAQGIINPWNALVKDMAEAMDLDATPYLIELPEQEQGPDPEQMKAEMELKKMELEMAMKEQEQQFKKDEHEMDIAFKEQTHELDMEMKQAEFAFKVKEMQLTLDFEQDKTKVQTQSIKQQAKAKQDATIEQNKIKAQNAKAQAKKKASAA